MVITQTVEIPENRRLHLDLEIPCEVPAGAVARFELVWSPKTEKAENLRASLKKIRDLCKDVPISVDSFFETRREDSKIEESRYKRYFGEGN
jgi:hypothetical protein